MDARTVVVRTADEADLPSVLAIYNDVIVTSTAVYREEPFTLESRVEWLAEHVRRGHPVLVATDSSGVLGFSAYAEFRTPPGYRFTVEHSVHVRADRRGSGIGRALMVPLIEHAKQAGLHAMIGGVDAQNLGSIKFHESLGFERAAYLRQVGFKFDRWLDLVFMELLLGP